MLNDNTENQNKEIQDFNTAVVHGLSDEAYLDDKLPDSHSIRKEKKQKLHFFFFLLRITSFLKECHTVLRNKD